MLGLFLFASCSIEKRRYNSGFHVEWLSSNGKKKSIETQKKRQFTHYISPKVDSLLSSFSLVKHVDSSLLFNSSHSALDFYKKEVKNNQVVILGKDSVKCDLMILKNGDELNVKVTEIGEDLVKYKLCNNLDGPIFTKCKTSA
jgi:hypothetical protein